MANKRLDLRTSRTQYERQKAKRNTDRLQGLRHSMQESQGQICHGDIVKCWVNEIINEY